MGRKQSFTSHREESNAASTDIKENVYTALKLKQITEQKTTVGTSVELQLAS